jgi:hypothetical protein
MKVEPQAKTKAASHAITLVRSGLLQRKCACGGSPGASGECAECQKEKLQRKAGSAARTPAVPPLVHEVLRSPGQPLGNEVRAFLEPHFGHDFSRVRVHTDERAAESARAVNALAYTVGRDVVFGSGQYSPETRDGRHLLAHELTHVVQQRSATRSADLDLSPAGDSAEREADLVAHQVTHVPRSLVQRQEADADSPPDPASQGATQPSQSEPAATVDGSQEKESEKGRCEDGKWIVGYDGCSGPGWITRAVGFDKDDPAGSKNFDTRFGKKIGHTGPCDVHDGCYQTCNPDPGARDKCDEDFRRAMSNICFSLPHSEEPAKSRCVKRAFKYYQVVRSPLGKNAFRKDQREVCACLAGSPAKDK